MMISPSTTTLPSKFPSPLTSKKNQLSFTVTVRFVEVTSVLLNVVVLNVFDSNLPNEPVDVDEPLICPAKVEVPIYLLLMFFTSIPKQ